MKILNFFSKVKKRSTTTRRRIKIWFPYLQTATEIFDVQIPTDCDPNVWLTEHMGELIALHPLADKDLSNSDEAIDDGMAGAKFV